jgi:hypothetical protein
MPIMTRAKKKPTPTTTPYPTPTGKTVETEIDIVLDGKGYNTWAESECETMKGLEIVLSYQILLEGIRKHVYDKRAGGFRDTERDERANLTCSKLLSICRSHVNLYLQISPKWEFLCWAR